MPTYSYRCKSCGHDFDRVQKISEEPIRECPKCKKTELKKVVTGGNGFQLKGKGWFNSGGY